MAFTNEKENKRTVDYDRNAYLVHIQTRVGRDQEKSGASFEFYWNDQKIVIFADDNTKVKNDKRHVEWNITTILCAESLNDKRDEMLDMIEEALCAYGYFYSHEKIQNLDVKIDKNFNLQRLKEN